MTEPKKEAPAPKELWRVESPTYLAVYVEMPNRHREATGWFLCDKLERATKHLTFSLMRHIPEICGTAIATKAEEQNGKLRVEFKSVGPVSNRMNVKTPHGLADEVSERLINGRLK